MHKEAEFQKLADKKSSLGEVVAIDRFVITLKGLNNATIGGMVMLESGVRAMVREVREDNIKVLQLTSGDVKIGMSALLQEKTLRAGAGKGLLGRVINPLGEPLDDKGSVEFEEKRDIFYPAPSIIEREMLDTQLPSGVTLVDTLFPIIMGQRIAVLGDAKTGKTTLLSRLAAKQKGTDRIVVYVLIGKRPQELNTLLSRFQKAGAMDNIIVVVADPFEPLPLLYIAPYAACAMAEHFWYGGKDVVIVYDDLSGHARAYREMSLLLRVNPGRESYPGDIFHLHSSLLERAGRIKKTGSTLTALPVVWTPNDNMTAYIPTNLISITDGHIFFDTNVYEEGIRPAVKVEISVSRIGARAKTEAEKKIMREASKSLATYREAQQFSHFGTDLAENTKRDLRLGRQIYAIFNQEPEELFSLKEQKLMLKAALLNKGTEEIDINKLKETSKDYAARLKDDSRTEDLAKQLLKQVIK